MIRNFPFSELHWNVDHTVVKQNVLPILSTHVDIMITLQFIQDVGAGLFDRCAAEDYNSDENMMWIYI